MQEIKLFSPFLFFIESIQIIDILFCLSIISIIRLLWQFNQRKINSLRHEKGEIFLVESIPTPFKTTFSILAGLLMIILGGSLLFFPLTGLIKIGENTFTEGPINGNIEASSFLILGLLLLWNGNLKELIKFEFQSSLLEVIKDEKPMHQIDFLDAEYEITVTEDSIVFDEKEDGNGFYKIPNLKMRNNRIEDFISWISSYQLH